MVFFHSNELVPGFIGVVFEFVSSLLVNIGGRRCGDILGQRIRSVNACVKELLRVFRSHVEAMPIWRANWSKKKKKLLKSKIQAGLST